MLRGVKRRRAATRWDGEARAYKVQMLADVLGDGLRQSHQAAESARIEHIQHTLHDEILTPES